MLKSPEVIPRGQAPREFEYSMADFERIRTLIYRRAGISLAPIKQDMVYSRLARRLRALRMTTFNAYLDYLEKADEAEWETFVNSLTTNLTSFFRESHHFDILNRFLTTQSHRPLTIWCSAASTGEEPYSLAITACESFGTLTPPVSIIASDIDTTVLKKGEAGVYPADRVEKMSQERLRQFFHRGTGNQEGLVRVRPELRKLISFTRINLLESRWPQIAANLDVIFCRNVMIYFDKPTQHQILKRFAPLLREDGLLFAGHSESFLHAADVVRPLGRTVYERADRHGEPRKGLL